MVGRDGNGYARVGGGDEGGAGGNRGLDHVAIIFLSSWVFETNS